MSETTLHGSEVLVPAAVRGDHAALRALWAQNRRWVAAILVAHMPGGGRRHAEEDLEDLLQEVAVTLVSKISTLEDAGAFRPWLRIIAINAARSLARKRVGRDQSRRMVALDDAGPQEDRGPDAARRETEPSGVAQAREDGARLLTLAGELPDEYREPLLLRALRGMSYRQIADAMGQPETTIENRIVRGRRMLRELSERHEQARGVDGVSVVGGGSAGRTPARETKR
ncbi:MAG: RNA polymerase sigma factor [Phycisphaerae bacterium]|nr:RNA polymerase sigma factor [Phycisphaerae bacterium]